MKRCSICKKDKSLEEFLGHNGRVCAACGHCRRDHVESLRAHRERKKAGIVLPKAITYETCCATARANGGVCLSATYETASTPMNWRCGVGHEFTTRFTNIYHEGHWCIVCAHARMRLYSLVDCQRTATERGGLCLSTTYVDRLTHLRWRCALGHEWLAALAHVVVNKSWCPRCAGVLKYTIEECRAFAATRGGACLTDVYKNALTGMQWRCREGHGWRATFSRIVGGSWCPHCASPPSERVARGLMEELLGRTFAKIRPPWLGGLELDGYNEELAVAFEYNGRQHYEFIPFFHDDEADFQSQLERDRRKAAICATRGVRLVVIPWTFKAPKPEAMRTFIASELVRLNVALPARVAPTDYSDILDEILGIAPQRSLLDELLE
jgi:hypothetical protein